MAIAVALWTTSLRAAVHVYCNDFRNPGLLAAELATMANVTEGRFEGGIGAGWLEGDYQRLRVPFDPAPARIERLARSVQLMRSAWEANPAWGPVPPLVMGGGGAKMLALAAREADIVSINVQLDGGTLVPAQGRTATDTATRAKLDVVAAHAGDRMDRLEMQVVEHAVDVTDDKGVALERAARSLDLTPAEADASPHVLVGSVSEVCDRLVERREKYGLSYITISGAAVDAFSPVVARLRDQ
jgi:probable F420-dependent oxidoreductase